MKYVTILLLLLLSVYPLSYAKYNWKKKNKLGAAGALFLAVISVALPAWMLLTR